MTPAGRLTRRMAILAAGGLLLAGCDDTDPYVPTVLKAGEAWSFFAQRALMFGKPLAREYRREDMSRVFKVNGSSMPESDVYRRHLANNFADWRLSIGGLVAQPLSLSLAELRRLPARTQITRHDCVEGWSCIGQWTGVPLSLVLRAAGLRPEARYVVFHCADDMDGSSDGSGLYYESIDLVDAFHPQTILAYAMNGETLPVGHGAPLRLRLERQLGYKMAKFIMSIEVTRGLSQIRGGHGGYWEDHGYDWYAGI
jgi:DMSO/TMAO reductase YedYZ molybdopterin-dependent catalytic subunit